MGHCHELGANELGANEKASPAITNTPAIRHTAPAHIRLPVSMSRAVGGKKVCVCVCFRGSSEQLSATSTLLQYMHFDEKRAR
jgi:hypothetical protein